MTTDWNKLMSETSFKIIREEEDLLAISLVGGDLNDFIVEFKDINIIYDGETSVNLEFDYSIIAEETSEITEDKQFDQFLTNILYSAIGEQMDPDREEED